METLKFRRKEHYGREDFYPANEAAQFLLDFKNLRGQKIKSLQRREIDWLRSKGYSIELVVEDL